MAKELDWDMRNGLTYLVRRVATAHDAYLKAQAAVPNTSGGSGLTPFLADVRRSIERWDKELNELLKFVEEARRG